MPNPMLDPIIPTVPVDAPAASPAPDAPTPTVEAPAPASEPAPERAPSRRGARA